MRLAINKPIYYAYVRRVREQLISPCTKIKSTNINIVLSRCPRGHGSVRFSGPFCRFFVSVIATAMICHLARVHQNIIPSTIIMTFIDVFRFQHVCNTCYWCTPIYWSFYKSKIIHREGYSASNFPHFRLNPFKLHSNLFTTIYKDELENLPTAEPQLIIWIGRWQKKIVSYII